VAFYNFLALVSSDSDNNTKTTENLQTDISLHHISFHSAVHIYIYIYAAKFNGKMLNK